MIIKKTIRTIIILLCLLGITISSINIVIWYKDTHKNKEIIKKIESKIKEPTKEDPSYSIDFDSLKKENSDTVAFLKVNGTNINTVVVKGNDNSYYLKHNFYKEYNIAGWVFSDYKNKFDGTDRNIVIFGHDTKDGSMFGTLKNTQELSWQENIDNQKIIFITENEKSYYQVFSTYISEPVEDYIKTDFISVSEFEDFIKKIKEASTYNYKVDVTKDDTILTLSSCTTTGTKRVVLHAKKIETIS